MVISAIDSTTDNWEVTINRDNYTFQQDVSAVKMGLTLGKKANVSVAKASFGIKYSTATTTGIIIETAMITGFKL